MNDFNPKIVSDASMDVDAFVESARKEGMDFETIRRLLYSAGWKDHAISNLFAKHFLKVEIPRAYSAEGPREVFLHVTKFVCMYVTVVSLVIMLFNLIDISIPDPKEQYGSGEWIYSGIRGTLSVLLVFAPLFIVFAALIQREINHGTMTARGPVQRWLTYLTLFVCVLSVLIDASSIIYWLLEGELTTRIVAKAVALTTVVGVVFAYMLMGEVANVRSRNNKAV